MDVPAFNAAVREDIIEKGGTDYAVVRYIFLKENGTPYNLVFSVSDHEFYIRYGMKYTDEKRINRSIRWKNPVDLFL